MLGYDGRHDAFLRGIDAAALFDFESYGYAHDEPVGAYVPNNMSWADSGVHALEQPPPPP